MTYCLNAIFCRVVIKKKLNNTVIDALNVHTIARVNNNSYNYCKGLNVYQVCVDQPLWIIVRYH